MGKFDAIIKESLSNLIVPLAKIMGIDLTNTEMLKDKLQYTTEREVDFLFKTTNKKTGKTEILQFDFQAANDMKMPKRMLYYLCMIDFNHELPVRQIVFYIGYEPLRMPNFIREKNLYYEYEIYDFRSLDANAFLNSNEPEAVIFAILADFKVEAPEVMIEKVLLRLNDLCTRKDELNKFAFQLQVLTSLRKFEPIVELKLKDMSLVLDIDVKKSLFYREGKIEGKIEGKEEGKVEMIEELLIQNHSIDFIANISKKSPAFILSIKERLIEEGRLIENTKKS
jgi:predicted transposase/invertase (TIGR01784 family)